MHQKSIRTFYTRKNSEILWGRVLNRLPSPDAITFNTLTSKWHHVYERKSWLRQYHLIIIIIIIIVVVVILLQYVAITDFPGVLGWCIVSNSNNSSSTNWRACVDKIVWKQEIMCIWIQSSLRMRNKRTNKSKLRRKTRIPIGHIFDIFSFIKPSTSCHAYIYIMHEVCKLLKTPIPGNNAREAHLA